MKKHSCAVLSMVLLFILSAMTYAKGEPKQKANGAFKNGDCFTHFNFEAPDRGYVDYFCMGSWAGCWAHEEVMQLHFGTYNGSDPEKAGRPVVYYLSRIVEGEEVFDPSLHPEFPPDMEPAYQNIAGYYYVHGIGDGGPGHEHDWWVTTWPPIPDTDEGLQYACNYFGLCASGEDQAQMTFSALVSGWAVDLFGASWIDTGGITIRNIDDRDFEESSRHHRGRSLEEAPVSR